MPSAPVPDSDDTLEMVVRGRGAGINPANRFDRHRLVVLDEAREAAARACPNGVQVATEVFVDRSRRIINRVDSPDLSFSWTLNPYRGCEHGCPYCYARPTHDLLGFSSGLDFETKIVAKTDAPALLRKELAHPAWAGEPIVMSGVTDCYQPLERRLRVTRGCLEVMAECRQPISLVTKNRLILRDVDLLGELNRYEAVQVAISVTTLDQRLAAAMEPRTSSPPSRLRAIRALTNAGVPVWAMVAPVIPGINDREIPAILAAVAQAGAIGATWIMLRLPHAVKSIFQEWLRRIRPEGAKRIISLIREVGGGALYNSRFGLRGRGQGARAEQIHRTFEVFRRRNGLAGSMPELSSKSFRHPFDRNQLTLFD